MRSVRDDTIRVFDSLDALSAEAAGLVVQTATDAVRRRGRFDLVLSGGSTPRRLFKLLARLDRKAMPWKKTHVFWSDERYVPPDSRDSNFAAAEADLLQHVHVPPLQIHRVPTDYHSHESAAIEYETRLRTLFPNVDSPPFDLALLGIGDDGHTASLFPGSSILENDRRWAAAVTGPEYRPPIHRITLTLRALNGARVAAFLVAGADKREALRGVLSGAAAELPAARIRPREELIWMVDRDAYDQAGRDDAESARF